MDRSTATISQDQWTRVVVLAPAPPPSSLANPGAAAGTTSLSPQVQAQFEQRDWFAIEHHDPYLALAELCLRERAQAARTAWGLQRMEKIALVILHPARWPDQVVAELTQAVQRHMPSASVHLADDAGIEPAPAASLPSQARADTKRNGRMFAPQDSADNAVPPAGLAAPSVAGDAGSPARVSRDEIDMLLRFEDALGAADTPVEPRR
jgi:hypothetical protein